jgi:hypothetical protein
MPPTGGSRRGPRLIPVELPQRGRVSIYAGVAIERALREVTSDLNLYQGVRLGQVLEAAYEQGRKDGAREAFEMMDSGLNDAKRAIPHRNPGRPQRRAR